MPISSFAYPDEDEVPYLEWFGPHFSSVFVALNPFIRIHDGEPYKIGHWIPHEVSLRAKKSGQACAVTWAEIASLCGFGAIGDVNQSLRLTGSKRIEPQFASAKNTETLLERCRENHLYPPDEGYPSPPFEWSLAAFARAQGHDSLQVGLSFSPPEDPLKLSELADPERIHAFANVAALDNSFYATIYTDYHYWLICQTPEALSKARPDEFFEGFYANSATNDFWGIPGNEPEGTSA